MENNIENRKYKNRTESLLKDFEASYGIKGVFKKLISKKKLSRSNAYLGLLLLNAIPEVRTFSYYDTDSWSHYENVSQKDERYKSFKSIASSEDFWKNGRFDLLVHIFQEKAQYVKDAWDMIPKLMYQTGWGRRSFRGSNLDDIYFVNQLNFLMSLINEMEYDMSIEDYVVYCNDYYRTNFSYVLAAAINDKNSDYSEFCKDIIYGRHELGKPNSFVIKAMLLSEDESAWEAIEKLLLSAQRQEGLRQTILECLDETSIGAMKRMIDVIIEHKLSRFSSVVRALDVWAGFQWEGEKEATISRFLTFAQQFLNHPDSIQKAIKSKDNAEVFMALWAQGVIDVNECDSLIDEILIDSTHEKVSLVLYFVSQVGLSTFSLKYGKQFLEHEDQVILCQAIALIDNTNFINYLSQIEKEQMFSGLSLRLDGFGSKKKEAESRVFSWLQLSKDIDSVHSLMINLLDLTNKEGFNKISTLFSSFSVSNREKVTGCILPDYTGYSYSYDHKKEKQSLQPFQRDFALSIIKDRAEYVKTAGLRAIMDCDITPKEIEEFESMLTRKSSDFRKSIIALIIKNGQEQVKESLNRLTNSKNQDQRLAGLDLLVWLYKQKDNKKWVSDKIEELSQKNLTSKEQVLLSSMTNDETLVYDSSNGFGLYDSNNIKEEYIIPKMPKEGVYYESVRNQVYGLSMPVEKINNTFILLKKILDENREYEYQHEDWNNSVVTSIVGNEFRKIKQDTKGMTTQEKLENLPLSNLWIQWYEASGLTPKDLFIIQLTASHNSYGKSTEIGVSKLKSIIYEPQIPKIGEYNWQNPIYEILETFSECFSYKPKVQFLEGLVADMFSKIDPNEVQKVHEIEKDWGENDFKTWRDSNLLHHIFGIYYGLAEEMSTEEFLSYWKLTFWSFSMFPDSNNLKNKAIPNLYSFVRAFDESIIGKDLLYWRIMQPDGIEELTTVVKNNTPHISVRFPFLTDIIDECRDRILSIELKRGDSSTSVTKLAQNIQRVYGVKNFVGVLTAMGKDKLHRGYIYSWDSAEYNKKEILSTLLKRCYPSKVDSQESFNELIKSSSIKAKRLCEAATYAPQWLEYVSSYLGWEEMASGVWWLHAHTNGYHSAETESEIAKYSSIDMTSFQEGAVDIRWFKECYNSLGKSNWKTLYDSAKYISDGGGHKRGMLYADVMLGNTKITEVTKRIVEKRNQDYLRVYGLVPLSKTNPDKDLLKRYRYLQQFKKESKEFGSQRQASEGIAVRVAMDNLARTAGFSDPIRLQWAMVTEVARDIITKTQELVYDDVVLNFMISEEGVPSIGVVKAGKKLKSIPAKLKKDKEVIKLKGYVKTLKDQYKRTKKSLELAMINGDHFMNTEVNTLITHPVVAPLLEQLVFISGNHQGFLINGELVSASGEMHSIGEKVKIAHCSDLYDLKVWKDYQTHCFDNEMKQPFKQIFRELYIPTEDEMLEKSISRRYAGHQVQVQKTVALLKGQGWTVDYEEGLQKVFHEHGVIAKMYAMADWFSPSDVESPTLETVEFFDKKTHKRISFDKIDKRIFSEVMRDIDLVVSVAHVGDVDPEASHSTVELRAVILKESCRLFRLKTVIIEGHHAKIKGELGEYTVHIGSGVCHKLPGVYLSILPVHSQHRGKMFLPFIDGDPKTAEIMSKVLLLSKDQLIQDPTILRQI